MRSAALWESYDENHRAAAVSAVADIVRACRDAEKGYSRAAQDVRDPKVAEQGHASLEGIGRGMPMHFFQRQRNVFQGGQMREQIESLEHNANRAAVAEQGRFVESEAETRKALALSHQQDPSLWCELAFLYWTSGQLDRMRSFMSELLVAHPNFGLARFLGVGRSFAFLAQNIYGGVEVAFGFDERFLAIHQTGTGCFAEFGDGGGSNFRHVERVDS